MPYIEKTKRPQIDKDPIRYSDEPGDMTYAFSKYFFKKWLESPRWTTYHKMRTWIRDPQKDAGFYTLYQGFISLTQFTVIDVQEAAQEAREEFFWRVVRKYEDGKRLANGCVFVETNAVS